jgi:hypothetical protein
MLAAVTPLPVIGVPVPLKYLDGMDSLLSIVQMPAGIPVATVAVGGARNAGLLAVRILAASDDDLRAHMIEFQARLTAQAKAKGAALRENLLSRRGRLSPGQGRRPAPMSAAAGLIARTPVASGPPRTDGHLLAKTPRTPDVGPEQTNAVG